MEREERFPLLRPPHLSTSNKEIEMNYDPGQREGEEEM